MPSEDGMRFLLTEEAGWYKIIEKTERGRIMEYTDISALAQRIKENISAVIVGKEEQLELILTAMLSGGHVLLEDVPGTGKTTLAKSLAKSVNCSFARVQFTPDLLPSDITGTRIYQRETESFTFLKGPAFTNILLADEINRATPRTQSALLECMEEKQITEGGITYQLEKPFLVIATQNPVETQGTFRLPEAQLDRFLICLSLGYPQGDEAVELMERFIRNTPLATLSPVAQAQELTEAAQLCTQCSVSRDVMRYMARLCENIRNSDKVRLGPSPRALLALMRCCQALAAIRGRDYVIPDDVKALAVPVLAHRVILRGIGNQNDSASVVEGIVKTTRVPTEA